MNLDLAGRTALVLGGTAGLGAASAQALSAEGATVVISGRDEARGRTAAAALRPAATYVPMDLGDLDGVRATMANIARDHPTLDIVVLNAGGPAPGPAVGLDPDRLAPVVDALLNAQLLVLASALPGMRERGWGRIVAVGSSGIVAPVPNLVASNAVRAALAGYLKTLAGELAADGVTVNMVLPGRIDTGRVTSLDAAAAKRIGTDAHTVRARSEATIPTRRYGRPAEFAAVVAFLCGAPASYVTGTAIRVDGGLVGSL